MLFPKDLYVPGYLFPGRILCKNRIDSGRRIRRNQMFFSSDLDEFSAIIVRVTCSCIYEPFVEFLCDCHGCIFFFRMSSLLASILSMKRDLASKFGK
ncbi:hypothetical protein CDAR_601911 [Caerostris darwini]|uniref:Uncharacterized protein n=1 Tax=Caerostris darwini TaxID=1538125 RepID=A0AAV4UQA8_9ARAC|nr:hypothetical protein CDAR_601911 [Caerostris darwini]